MLVLVSSALAASHWAAHIDLFDVSSPGFGAWVEHVARRDDGRPRWHAFLAGGVFNHYHDSELADRGWGHAAELRPYARLGGGFYLWRGLSVGVATEMMWRLGSSPGADAHFMPTVQPLVAYRAEPWGAEPGRAAFLLWIAPRVPLLHPDLLDGSEVIAAPVIEFASGLNLVVNL